MRPRSAEWYFDADTIGVGRVLAAAGVRATWPGDDGTRRGRAHLTPSPIDRTDIADEVWIEEVTRAGMTIITRDRRIASRTSEVDAVIASRARVFALTVSGDNDLWRLVRLVATRWPEIEQKALEPGPFVMSVTWTGIRQVAPALDT